MDHRSQIEDLKQQFRDWAWLRAARIPSVFHDSVRRDARRLFRVRLRELKEQGWDEMPDAVPAHRAARLSKGL